MPLDATMAPASFDAEARTVEATIATATPVLRRDARGPYREVLDFATLGLANAANLRLLDSHRTSSVRDTLGNVEAVRIEGDRLVAKLRLSAADDVAPVLQRIADGTLRGVSIGYRVTRWREETSGGVRTRRPDAWALTEVTLTSNPADPAATLRQEGAMPEDVIDTPPADDAEKTRRSEIRTLVRSAGLDAEIADDLIDAGADLTHAKAEIFDAQAQRQRSAPIIRSHAPANDDPAVISRRQSDAVAFRMAGGDLPEDARQFVNMSLRDMAADSLARNGVSTRGMPADEVFTRAAHTSSDFPLVVSSAANKVALESYKAAESPLKALCRQRTLPNFKESTAIRLGEMGRLAAMQFAYLAAAQGVQIQRAEAWDTLGLKFRAFLDFGAGWPGWRPVQRIAAA